MAAEFATDQTEAARYLDKVRAYMGRRSLGAVATTLDNFVDYLKEHFPCPEMFGAVVDVGDVEDRCPENYFVEADRMLDLARGGGIVATAAPCAHGKTCALRKWSATCALASLTCASCTSAAASSRRST